jgi:hypothetical protein
VAFGRLSLKGRGLRVTITERACPSGELWMAFGWIVNGLRVTKNSLRVKPVKRLSHFGNTFCWQNLFRKNLGIQFWPSSESTERLIHFGNAFCCEQNLFHQNPGMVYWPSGTLLKGCLVSFSHRNETRGLPVKPRECLLFQQNPFLENFEMLYVLTKSIPKQNLFHQKSGIDF